MKVVAEPSDAVVDIVFVHGLTGNRETTWTHDNGVFWPEQLALDIDTARIMTYGYNANIFKIWGMAGGNNLRNHGKSLAFGVSDRRRECRERPIIFIAHSLGGLVCEQALLYCGEGGKKLEKVFRSTRGIIFMGTTHAGSDLANWGYVLAALLSTVRNTNSAILDPLRQKSDVLTAIQQQFQQCLRKPGVNIEIYCFFEEKAVVGVGVIVPESSATLSQYPNQSTAANHMDMMRFSGAKDEGYQKVLSRLQDTIEMMEPSEIPSDDPKSHLDDEKRKRCHRIFRTCQWFLRHPNYTSWQDSNSSGILWVSADPGCGKSVLAKLLVDKELEATKSRTTCYFFFKDDNDIQKIATSALCALLHQIFSQKPELLVHAVEISDKNKEACLNTSVELLWKILITAAEDPRAGEIICILDALDECRHSELKPLLRKLCSFYDGSRSSSNTTLKFIVTSRPLQHIENEFGDLSRKIPAIRLAGEEHTDEILHETGLVIEHEIEKNPAGISHASKNCPAYLWLMLIFDLIRQDLQSVMTNTEREKLFHTIPKSVDTAYTAILNKSTNMDRARKLLKIVCAAIRPLSTMEITTALLIQEDHKTYDDLEIPPDGFSKTYLRNLFGLFVSVIDGRVFLLHQTAKEFLMAKEDHNPPLLHLPCDEIWKNSFTIHDSNFLLASLCMWFQRLEEFKSSRIKKRTLINLSLNTNSLSTQQMLCQLLAAPSIDINVVTKKGMTPLLWAAEFGNEAIVAQLLIVPSIDVNAANKLGETALERAGSKAIIVGQLLAAPGIDVNAANNAGMTPLWEAASRGYEAIVAQLLAAPGIDVDAADNIFDPSWVRWCGTWESAVSPLWKAADQGYAAVVAQLLAAPNIDINAESADGITPLWQAVRMGRKEVVGQMLAAPGIKVNIATTGAGITALNCAAIRGSEEILDQLLAAPGIDVNAATENGTAPLMSAASSSRQGIVGKLLAFPSTDANAVNAADKNGKTPLWWAAQNGHEVDICELLAAPSINVNAANKDGQTPLFVAASEEYDGVIGQLLAVPSINVNAAGEDGHTPLWLTACEGHNGLVGQLLAAPGIGVNMTDSSGNTPLMYATFNGYEAIVGQLLADPNIDINYAYTRYGTTALSTALSIAQSRGTEGILQLLQSKISMVAKNVHKDST
ncbi:hypothetical protein VE02_09662 [Pseudogymnoascus sp. 03VT05]|nr:hypothetical protein VE02_09662 [Pseudogymnoascus sp. 03VT05]